MRTTQTMVTHVYWPDRSTRLARPLFMVSVSAGLPTPAEDYIEGRLDLNRHLIKHPAATFFVRVAGDSMIDAGIHPGDILVVDRSVEPQDGRVVIAIVDGELTVKRIARRGDALLLLPDNPAYQPLEIKPETEFEVWGVVTSVIHHL
jgi:DNA polymerase V